jgi:hypothetical protein
MRGPGFAVEPSEIEGAKRSKIGRGHQGEDALVSAAIASDPFLVIVEAGKAFRRDPFILIAPSSDPKSMDRFDQFEGKRVEGLFGERGGFVS